MILNIPKKLIYIPDCIHRFAERNECILKGEFHFTILGFSLQSHPKYAEIEQKVAQMSIRPERFEFTDWHYCKRKYEQSEYVEIAHVRKSVLVMVNLPDLVEFFQGYDIEYLPHVTVFVGRDNPLGSGWKMGIGNPSPSELAGIEI